MAPDILKEIRGLYLIPLLLWDNQTIAFSMDVVVSRWKDRLSDACAIL